MDINKLYTAPSHEKGAEVRVINPVDGKLTSCYITVVGVDSKTFRGSQRKRQRELLDSLQNKEEVKDDQYGLLADCCISWRGFTDKGKDLEFSQKSVLALFDNSPKIAEQVDRFIADRKNFMKG